MASFGGRTLTQNPALIQKPQKEMGATAYGLFDSYIGMRAYRELAVTLYGRIQGIHFKLDAGIRANAEKVQKRLSDLESQLLSAESLFLQNERAADAYWRELNVTQRKEEEFDTMLVIAAAQPTILGLWRHPFTNLILPDTGHRINPTVLAFATPQQAKVYGGMK